MLLYPHDRCVYVCPAKDGQGQICRHISVTVSSFHTGQNGRPKHFDNVVDIRKSDRDLDQDGKPKACGCGWQKYHGAW